MGWPDALNCMIMQIRDKLLRILQNCSLKGCNGVRMNYYGEIGIILLRSMNKNGHNIDIWNGHYTFISIS